MNTGLFKALRHSLRWKLFITLGTIMFVCQLITVLWLWHESKEQIEALANLSLTRESVDKIIRQEQIESIMALTFSVFTMMSVTLLLSYKAIKWVTAPLEKLEVELNQRTAENLTPIDTESKLREMQSITGTLNQLFNRLNDTLQQERLFTADVAHELRTPLAGIRLQLELMEKTYHLDNKVLIGRIDRLVSTVEQLLTLSRASQKFTVGQYQHIQVNRDIIDPLFEELFEMAEQKQQTLGWKLSEPEMAFYGDTILLRLLIRNLVENACRYSPEETEITVTFRHSANGKQAIIDVDDQGEGINETKTEQLTQAFFRMDRRYKGIGLGLSIVSHIVKLHQGTFSLKNHDNGLPGTRARSVFPANPHNTKTLPRSDTLS